jgi:hypothetical protein
MPCLDGGLSDVKKTTKTLLARSGIGGAALILALVGALSAYAYWTANGSGSGAATATTTTDNLTISSVPVTGAAPGLSTPVTVTVSNPNTYSVGVGTVSAVVATSVAGCLAADFTFPDTVLNTTIAALGSTSFVQNLDFADTAVSQDACKGASVTLTYASD